MSPTSDPSQPVAHWSFQNDLVNGTSHDFSSVAHGVTLEPANHPRFRTAARFNGEGDHLVVDSHPALHFGSGDFSVALWVETDSLTDLVGDLACKFDFARRQGWNFNVVTNSGTTTTTQSNYRHVHFGIDQGRNDSGWTFCGRPGQAAFVYALTSIEGELYAGTFEPGADECGHLWRYRGGEEWQDLGASPDSSNTITSIAWLDGALHVSSGRYYATGTCLEPTLNRCPGGHVYRVEPDGQWVNLGNPGLVGASPEPSIFTGYEAGDTDLADETSCLTVYRGELYATPYHRRRGVFRYAGNGQWEALGLPERVMSMAVFRDRLHVLVNGGEVFYYEGGKRWRSLGTPHRSTQNYGVAVHRGKLHVGTWPECEVFAHEGGKEWRKLGRVGYEREVMAFSLYNGKIYLGTLPMANGWRMDDDKFTFIGNADGDPAYRLRRLWSMAVHKGQLFAGTAPSGHVVSFEAGKSVTSDRILPGGWHHLAAVRKGGRLTLWLNGREWAESSPFPGENYSIDNDAPLRIGFGAHDYFKGKMADFRLYQRALDAREIGQLFTGVSNTSGKAGGM